MLDTYIVNRDDVPFTLPGKKELISTQAEFKGKDVPDFVQILQNPDLSNPGIVAQLNLRISDKLEAPSRFLLTRYPVTVTNDKKSLDKWDVPLLDFGDDSSVVMYWDEKELKPKETREVAFAYGLGSVSVSSPTNAKLAVTVGGAMHRGGELTVVALVADPAAKRATLKLPEGLEAIDPLTQDVPPSRSRDGKPNPRR